MYGASGLEYVFIPSQYADIILQDFVRDSANLGTAAGYWTTQDLPLPEVAAPMSPRYGK